MAKKKKHSQQKPQDGTAGGESGPSAQQAQTSEQPSAPSGQVAPPTAQGSQGQGSSQGGSQDAPASQGAPSLSQISQGDQGGAHGGRGGAHGGRGGAGGGRGGARGGRGGARGGQGVPWQAQGAPPAGRGATIGDQQGAWQGRGGPPGSQGSQGGPWQGRGGPPGSQPSQGGPWQGRGGPPGSQPSQGGPWQGRGGPPGSQPSQGGPWQRRGGPPGSQPSQGGPWQGHGIPSSGQPVPPPQQTPQQSHPAQKQQLPTQPQQPPIQIQQPPAQTQQPPTHTQQPPTQKQQPPAQKQQPPAQKQQPPTQKQPTPQEVASSLASMQVASSKPSKSGSPAKQSIPSSVAEQLKASIPVRKNPMKAGTLGRPITVETNMMSIVLNKNFRTHTIHYDVTIDPDRPKFLMRPVFEELRKQQFPRRYPAFDGKKNAYSAGNLLDRDIIQGEVEIFDAERQQKRTFKITLKKVNEIDLSWLQHVRPGLRETEREQTGIQVLDIILRQGPSMHSITLGRSFFHPPRQRLPLGNGLDLWVGAFQSAVLGWKPYLNIDVAHKGCPTPQNVISLLQELCKDRPDRPPREINPRDIEYNVDKIESYLRGLKVLYEIPGNPHSKRTHRVNSLAESPRTNKFKLNSGQLCTVLDYYLKEKNYRIKYPDIPCLWVGSRDKKIYVPPELCEIVPGQMIQKKMDEIQTSAMIKFAATNTKTRKDKIMNGFAALHVNENPTMQEEFRLSVEGKFEEVPARVLRPPDLLYYTPKGQNERFCRVNKGIWRAENFFSAADLPDNSWSILNLNEKFVNDSNMYELQHQLQNGARNVGMTVGKAYTPFKSMSPPSRDIREIMNYFAEMKKLGLKLIIVIIPDRVDVYSKVKQVTELKIGVLTQCLKTRTLQRMSPPTVCNILLKVNSKLNGTNHTIAPTTKPKCLNLDCMIVGADVTHPSPDARDIPSIAAVAASHDKHAFQYNIEVRLQPPKTEIIQDLSNIICIQLKYFYSRTGRKPTRIIFYRDGVSEGQLPQVMHHEIAAIKSAFRKLSPSGDYNPPITFLVVQKRHHIRLFPTSEKNSDDRNFNVQAGTIVDTHITHPSHIDFYLVSHASIQGTARPTKYRCICNETDDSEDDIEQLTYYLCHMFSRCTRSVSYPAPTYYAHLAASRARALTYQVDINLDNLLEEQQRKLSLLINKDAPMFFV